MTSRRGVLSRVTELSCASVFVLVSLAAGLAQERATPSTDPRVGLKAGFHNAGEAARNMEVIASLPKPEGFFDPKTPAGATIPAERVPNSPTGASVEDPPDPNANAAAPTPPRPGAPPPFDPVTGRTCRSIHASRSCTRSNPGSLRMVSSTLRAAARPSSPAKR